MNHSRHRLILLTNTLRRERTETIRLRARSDDRRRLGLDVEHANLIALESAARSLKAWQALNAE